MTGERILLLDASTFITLVEISYGGVLREIEGDVRIPTAVIGEIRNDPAASALDQCLAKEGEEDPEAWIERIDVERAPVVNEQSLRTASSHLGTEYRHEDPPGDVELLAIGRSWNDGLSANVIVLTDDKPLRKACKALGIPVSGSIGILISAVERGFDPDEAKDALVAMDEVGARLSARLLRKAERLIDEAAERSEE